MNKPNTMEDKNESLRTQLIQLNERSRWYSSQLWQIPFAYISLAVVAISTVIEKHKTMRGLVFLALAIIGGFVIWHMISLAKRERRAISNLQKIETELFGEEPTVKMTPTWLSFFIAVIFAVVCLFGSGIFFLIR